MYARSSDEHLCLNWYTISCTQVIDHGTAECITRCYGKCCTPLNPHGQYRIALRQFLSGGGDGYSMLKEHLSNVTLFSSERKALRRLILTRPAGLQVSACKYVYAMRMFTCMQHMHLYMYAEIYLCIPARQHTAHSWLSLSANNNGWDML